MIRAIDLFAGIGGIRLAFENSNTEFVFTSEIDKFARTTYEANFQDNFPIQEDITKIEAKDIPDFDLLLAGFPCQPFSNAGLKRGFEDTRGTLFFDIARILAEKQPQAFMLENVKGLITNNKGDTFKTILNILQNDLNYKIYYTVLDAKDFGLPQHRERLIIVGFKNHDVDFHFPQAPKTETKMKDILEPKVDDKYTLSDKMWNCLLEHKKRHEEAGHGFGYGLLDDNSSYSRSLLARYYKDGSDILIKQNNKNPRKLTPRECARLQGFPDTFILPCSNTQTYKQLGNSVPVPMIKAIANEIYKVLEVNND